MLNLLFSGDGQAACAIVETWNVKVMSVIFTLAVTLIPADYDEIILESRSSELLLRNLKSDISDGQQMWFHLSCCRLLEIILFVAGLWLWMLKMLHFL